MRFDQLPFIFRVSPLRRYHYSTHRVTMGLASTDQGQTTVETSALKSAANPKSCQWDFQDASISSQVKVCPREDNPIKPNFTYHEVITQFGAIVISLFKNIFHTFWKPRFDIFSSDFLQCPSTLRPVPLILPSITSLGPFKYRITLLTAIVGTSIFHSFIRKASRV